MQKSKILFSGTRPCAAVDISRRSCYGGLRLGNQLDFVRVALQSDGPYLSKMKHPRPKRLRWLAALALALALACTAHPADSQEQATDAAQPSPTPEEIAPVAQIGFTGNTVVPSPVLADAAGVRAGQALAPGLLAEAIRRIEQAYTQRGYISTVTYYEIRDDPPPRTLIFHIREATLPEIRITGLRRTREQTVRRFIEAKPGDVYSQAAVERDAACLNELGIFEEVRVFIQQGEEPQQIVLILDLKEAKPRRVELSGSYSPEGRLVAQVRYTHLNLFGRAQQLSGSVSIGTIQGKIGGDVSYFNPLFGRPRTTLSARAFSDVFFKFSEDLANEPEVGRYFERTTGIEAAVSQSAGRAKRISYTLRYGNTSIENLPVELLAPGSPPSDAAVVASSVRYAEDRRVFLVLPASGNYLSGLIEPAYVDFDPGGAEAIAKAQGEWRRYFPLRKISLEALAAENPRPARTLAIRLRAGASAGDLPFFEQFFVGGITDLRGYRESRFWGKRFLTLNMEIRWPLNRRLVGVAFADAGDAWGSDFQFRSDVSTVFRQHKRFSPRAGAGVGIWWASEFGLIRVEYARGEANRLHFAVGESF